MGAVRRLGDRAIASHAPAAISKQSMSRAENEGGFFIVFTATPSGSQRAITQKGYLKCLGQASRLWTRRLANR